MCNSKTDGEELVDFLTYAADNSQLTVTQALVKYLRDHREFELCEIANALNRDRRQIWTTYQQAKMKIEG